MGFLKRQENENDLQSIICANHRIMLVHKHEHNSSKS